MHGIGTVALVQPDVELSRPSQCEPHGTGEIVDDEPREEPRHRGGPTLRLARAQALTQDLNVKVKKYDFTILKLH
jgi:hypothetical protein